jgi:hypothetical protein
MVWKVRADCTYTTASTKTTAQSAAQTVLDSYNVTPVAGRFAPGIASLSTTRFTISVDAATQADAVAVQNDLTAAMLSGKTRAATIFSIHDAGDG